MIEYLLDTIVISELRKSKPHGAILAWIREVKSEQLFISTLTFGELQAGVERLRLQDVTRAAEIERWIDDLSVSSQVIPMDIECFREWARLMVGRSDELSEDAMIAATARIHHLKVVTRNERDFRHFAVDVVNPFSHK